MRRRSRRVRPLFSGDAAVMTRFRRWSACTLSVGVLGRRERDVVTLAALAAASPETRWDESLSPRSTDPFRALGILLERGSPEVGLLPDEVLGCLAAGDPRRQVEIGLSPPAGEPHGLELAARDGLRRSRELRAQRLQIRTLRSESGSHRCEPVDIRLEHLSERPEIAPAEA